MQLKRIYLPTNSVGPDGIRVLMESIVEKEEEKDQLNNDMLVLLFLLMEYRMLLLLHLRLHTLLK